MKLQWYSIWIIIAYRKIYFKISVISYYDFWTPNPAPPPPPYQFCTWILTFGAALGPLPCPSRCSEGAERCGHERPLVHIFL